MLYAIMPSDVKNSLDLRKKARDKHLARLDKLKNENRLIIAGPHPLPNGETGFSGSLIIAEFDSLQEAENWANEDPFFHAGVYESVIVKPFKKVLP